VCAAPCEDACRRNNIDHPVTIRALKRFVTERYGVEHSGRLPHAQDSVEGEGVEFLAEDAPGNSNTVESLAALLKATSKRKPTRRKARVAVIGAGPAGLTAANNLAIYGYEVTVFEAAPVPGGMLVLGIPEYRLPRNLVRFEIEEILKQGVELKLNVRLGKDFTISSLKDDGYEAIFIAIGAYVDRDPGAEGADLDGVIYSLDFLREANLGNGAKVGNRVLVIGGGGTAVDAARTMLRLDEGFLEKDGVAALDAARDVLRLGTREVHMLYRGSRAEMRAPDEEVQDAVDEGVFLHTSRAPVKIHGQDGKVTGLETIRMESIYDEAGKRTLNFVPNSEEIIEGDTIIVATGQGSDLSFINPKDGLEVSTWGTILVDPDSLATTAPGIFAGGDVAFGPRIIIESVKDGHQAARSIDDYLQKSPASIIHRTSLQETPAREWFVEGGLEIAKERASLLPLQQRTGISEVEQDYDEETAVEQADRCLRCHIQTVFDADLCILCGGCVDVCPQNCYKMVRLDKIQGNSRLEAIVETRYGISLDSFRKGGQVLDQGTAMIKDETRCIRCGLCAKRCPTGAITMEAFQFEEELVYEENAGKSLGEGADSR
jgi:NADPH-dependent glutamate synthase beta subunit-like oxidoreductase/ferredoxin